MNIWVDDVRNPKKNYYEDYIWVKTYNEAIALLKSGEVEIITLDHDLGDADPNHTGYDIVCWIENQVLNHGMKCPEIWCHSWNPVGRKNIQQVIDKLNQFKKEKIS